jgi:hypothetical protein
MTHVKTERGKLLPVLQHFLLLLLVHLQRTQRAKQKHDPEMT